MDRVGTRLMWMTSLLLTVGCGGQKEAGNTATATTVADTGATLNPPAELSMDVQHRTMDSVQANYGNLLTALAAKDKAGVSAAAGNIATLADRIPVFMIHKAGVSSDSLTPWSRKLKGQAVRTAELASADNFDAAQEMSGRLNATCNTCHDMYREEAAAHEHAETEAHEHAEGEKHEHAPAKKPSKTS
jgi:hypothetical protein